MGNSISGLLAILFMGTLENKALNLHPNISIYRRYVDDTCIVTTNREEADRIFEILNNQHKNIKFEIEYPLIENLLSLLDFKFHIDQQGHITFKFYQKSAKKLLFLHEASNIHCPIGRLQLKKQS